MLLTAKHTAPHIGMLLPVSSVSARIKLPRGIGLFARLRPGSTAAFLVNVCMVDSESADNTPLVGGVIEIDQFFRYDHEGDACQDVD